MLFLLGPPTMRKDSGADYAVVRGLTRGLDLLRAALRAELTGMIDRYEPRPGQSADDALAAYQRAAESGVDEAGLAYDRGTAILGKAVVDAVTTRTEPAPATEPILQIRPDDPVL